MKRIISPEEAKADIRAVPQHIAMNILTAIHRLAESGAGRVKTCKTSAARSASAPAITASLHR